ncbi:ashwin [Scyliorhinus torazame]|uniref:ashwin n=1 Tax=Scyliorhinus torazame TaxID=75743 RepID=UPI003B5AEBE4
MAVAEVGLREFDSQLLLHPEILSGDFLLHLLQQRKITTENLHDAQKDQIVEVYIQHVIPLPQRELPKNRWGKMMAEKRGQQPMCATESKRSSMEGSRKRPLIVFDGSSTSTKIKLMKTENAMADQVKPLPPRIMGTSPKNNLAIQPSSTNILTDNNTVKSPIRNVVPSNGMAAVKHGGNMPLKTSPLLYSTSGGTNPIKLKRALANDGEGDAPVSFKIYRF